MVEPRRFWQRMFRFDRRLFENFDMMLMFLIAMVCIMGFFNLYSASYAPQNGGLPAYMRQAYFFLMGFAAFVLIISVDYQELHFWNYPIYVIINLQIGRAHV
jgi:rod shape determining protein RodA